MYLASLLLGLAAWAAPVVSIVRKKNCTAASFILCTASLYLEICQTNILVNKGDWAAIEDTYPAIAFAATVLISVTVVLNAIAAVFRRKDHKI